LNHETRTWSGRAGRCFPNPERSIPATGVSNFADNCSKLVITKEIDDIDAPG